MDRRTKILTTLFGAFLAYALVSGVVYPRWIEPLLKIDGRIADRQEEYNKLAEVQDQVDRAKKEYEALVSRIGSFDIGKVETNLRARLNELIEEHQLQDANVSPSRPTQDRKTGLTTMTITVTAVGKLRSVVEFIKDVTEFPHLVRIGNAAVYPAGTSGRNKSRNRMNVRVPIEVMVLPPQRLVGPIDDEIEQPEWFVRHEGRDYSFIWVNKPFTEPIPLKAEAGSDVNVEQGRSARLRATASGGDFEYTYKWSPTDALSDATVANPTVDTSEPFERTYTVTVTDSEGEVVTDEVTVIVCEKQLARGEPPPPPPPPKHDGPSRWDGKYMQVCMALIHSTEAGRVAELMISNNRSKGTEYYAAGDEFDGGELVFVHPRGAVVRRKDEYSIYPIGGWLDQDIKIDAAEAAEYPELLAAAEQHREMTGAESETQEGEEAAAPTDGEPETPAAETVSADKGDVTERHDRVETPEDRGSARFRPRRLDRERPNEADGKEGRRVVRPRKLPRGPKWEPRRRPGSKREEP